MLIVTFFFLTMSFSSFLNEQNGVGDEAVAF